MYNRTDPEAIHETIIRDVIDVLMDVKDTDQVQFMLGKKGSFKSVASASSSLTIVFPHVVSRSIDISNAIMTNKAQERKCVSMLQMLFSAFQVTDASDAIEYVSKFHTNLKLDDDISVDKFIDLVDSMASRLDECSGITLNQDMYEAIKEDIKHMNYYLPDPIAEMTLSNYKYGSVVGGRDSILSEAPAGDSITKKLKDGSDTFKNQILDSDIKKANELMPTMMIINFMTTGGVELAATQAVIGVKVKMYPADSEDIINRIRSKNQDGNGVNTFIRATTAELSFWKDFVFALDKAKLDALSSSKRGGTSAIWKLLERRAVKSRLRRTFRFTNDATAITTLTITDDEVQYLRKTENINIKDIKTARQLMEAFNLMSIIIVNEALECADFIYDTGDDLYETVTFTSLERDSSDATYKRVVNLMTKMR